MSKLTLLMRSSMKNMELDILMYFTTKYSERGVIFDVQIMGKLRFCPPVNHGSSHLWD